MAGVGTISARCSLIFQKQNLQSLLLFSKAASSVLLLSACSLLPSPPPCAISP